MRHLDFIVFGVPRSGTTALAKALNLHRDIFCAIECFYYHTDPRRIVFPDSFRKRLATSSLHKHKLSKKFMEKKGDGVAFVGDKNPRYHTKLASWKALDPTPKMVAIYRSPYDFLHSWRRRASDSGDNWPKEQVGLFGLLEMLVLLRTSLDHADDTLFVPYDACFFDNPEAIKRVVAHIGADPAHYNHKRFLRAIFTKDGRSRERPPLPDDEMGLLEAANTREIDGILLRDDPVVIGDLRNEIESYLGNVPPQLAALGEQWLAARRSASFSRFLRSWTAHFPNLDAVPNPAAIPPTLARHASIARTKRARLARGTRKLLGTGVKTLSSLSRRLSGRA